MRYTIKSKPWYIIGILASLVIFSEVIAFRLPLWTLSEPWLKTARLFHTIFAIGVLALSGVFRNSQKSKSCNFLYIALVLPFLVFSWWFHLAGSKMNVPWVPFNTHKVIFTLLAILAPSSYWVSFLLIGLFSGQCILMWFTLDLSHNAAIQNSTEPWFTLLYAVVSVAMICHKINKDKLDNELRFTQSQSASFEKLAKFSLYIRDRTNTPLQTMVIAMELLRRNERVDREVLQTMHTSVQQLEKLNVLLKQIEPKFSWNKGDIMSDKEVVSWIHSIGTEPT